MKMIRTIYHIAGKDYEGNQKAELTFNVQTISIDNFLKIAKESHCFVKSYSSVFNDSQITYTNGAMKSITLFAWSPLFICILAQKLGKKEWNCIDENWNIRNTELRSTKHKSQTRYNGVLCFDPATKATKLISNSPIKIIDRQVIFNGKLYRKFYGSDMR